MSKLAHTTTLRQLNKTCHPELPSPHIHLAHRHHRPLPSTQPSLTRIHPPPVCGNDVQEYAAIRRHGKVGSYELGVRSGQVSLVMSQRWPYYCPPTQSKKINYCLLAVLLTCASINTISGAYSPFNFMTSHASYTDRIRSSSLSSSLIITYIPYSATSERM